MESLLDHLPCGVVAFDDRGTVLVANQTLADLLGYSREEVEGQHVERLLSLAGRIFFQTHLYPLTRLHSRADEIFLFLRRKDGAEVGTLLNAFRHERDGRAVTDCVFMEVRERLKYEDALLRAKRAADEARDALAERGRELEQANKTLGEQAVELELQQQTLQEQTTELEAQSDALLEANEQLLRNAEALEQARGAAEEANRAKTQFLGVMSHELRTPLNAIGGYTQLLELGVHGPVNDGQRDALGRIGRAQQHLLRLINDLLNLSRIEAGKVEYVIETVPIDDVIASVVPMLEPQIATSGLRLVVDAGNGLKAHADRDKVQQIIINLVTNAVKFTPRGGLIRVEARSAADGDCVHVDVADSGVGISAAKLDRVFDAFVQVDESRARRSQGSGLGLAISRNFARAMGGDLSVVSEEGHGSTFTLTLPTSAESARCSASVR
jgi:PAS domain S-box-containing protein